MSPSGTRILLLVNDDPAERQLLNALAARSGWRTVFADDGASAARYLGSEDGATVDVVLVDQWPAEAGQGNLIAQLHAMRGDLPILLMASRTATASGAEALRAGATDFLIKPLTAERLSDALEAAIGDYHDARELRPLTEKLSRTTGFDQIVGADSDFRSAMAIAAKAARGRMPILIEGEPGTGKETLARAIHAASPRARKPFVIARCRSLPANLVMSYLFGHVRGAFPGAFEAKSGIIADADGGTLLIDDIGALCNETQHRLLEFIDSGYCVPIGNGDGGAVDVRLIVALNGTIADTLAEGSLRDDLFFRLATVQAKLPPLRARRSDIPVLARHLLNQIGQLQDKPSLGITDDALALLLTHAWPGNVRQLHDALFRAAALCQGDALTAQDFPQLAIEAASKGNMATIAPALTSGGVELFMTDGHLRPLDAIEADVIRLAIGHYRGRMTEVARRLGIGRSTLYRKLAELGISEAA